ncbi:hypothetical protein C8R45DRAFT_1217383 [Mycena sanguinolenta]|nr:hypothetical protein C8R45DRAFT_1217383 [Mycena sanguinolenta]
MAEEGADITYESPKLVKSQIDAWTSTVQSAAVVTTLFAGMSAGLLGVIKSDDALKSTHGVGMTALLSMSFSAMLFNAIATMASLLLTDRLGDIDFDEAQRINITIEGRIGRLDSSLNLLSQFGAHKNFKWIFIQWMLYMFIGMLCMLAQIIIYMWLGYEPIMSTIITFLTGAAVVVLVLTSL